MIYTDNAATTALDIDAFETMKLYLVKEYGNASQPYSFARAAKKALAAARDTIAAYIGARSEDFFLHPAALKVIIGQLKVYYDMVMIVKF